MGSNDAVGGVRNAPDRLNGNVVYRRTLEIGEHDVGDEIRCSQAKRRRAQRSWKR